MNLTFGIIFVLGLIFIALWMLEPWKPDYDFELSKMFGKLLVSMLWLVFIPLLDPVISEMEELPKAIETIKGFFPMMITFTVVGLFISILTRTFGKGHYKVNKLNRFKFWELELKYYIPCLLFMMFLAVIINKNWGFVISGLLLLITLVYKIPREFSKEHEENDVD